MSPSCFIVRRMLDIADGHPLTEDQEWYLREAAAALQDAEDEKERLRAVVEAAQRLIRLRQPINVSSAENELAQALAALDQAAPADTEEPQ